MANGLFVKMRYKPEVGGAEEHAHQMVKHLTEMGERMVVLAPLRPDVREDPEFDATCGYPIIRFETKVSSGEWRTFDDLRKRMMFRDVLRAIREVEADYVISSASSILPTASVLFAAKIARIPHFDFVHHISPRTRGLLRVLEDFKLRACSTVLCVSNDTAREAVKRGVDPLNVRVIPNGFDMDEIDLYQHETHADASSPVSIEYPPDCPVLLTVSRLVEYKGIQRVIEAMPKILSKVPGTRYVIVGDGGYREELEQLVRVSPAQASIVFLGAVSDFEKFACYERCSVFVMPSEEEGFGIVYLEANAFGKPVIGSDVMGVPEAILHGETGLLVDPYDADAIADAAIYLLQNIAEAHRLGENGRRRVENELTWKASAEKLLTVTRAAL